MYLLLDENTGALRLSNEPAHLEEESVLLPCEGLCWTNEAMRKIAPEMRKIFEYRLRYLLCDACDYGPAEALQADFEDLAPALEFVTIEEVREMEMCYHLKGKALTCVLDNLDEFSI